MKSILLALFSAVFFATFMYIAYDIGFGHGVDLAREDCGSVIVSVGLEAGASLETIKSMVSTICYGGN